MTTFAYGLAGLLVAFIIAAVLIARHRSREGARIERDGFERHWRI